MAVRMPPKPRAPHRGRDPNAEPSALQGSKLDPEEEYNFDTAGCARPLTPPHPPHPQPPGNHPARTPALPPATAHTLDTAPPTAPTLPPCAP